MKLVSCIAGRALLADRGNGDVLKGLDMDQIRNQLAQYKQNWLGHVTEMKDVRHPKQLLGYRPSENGDRNEN